MFRQFIIITLEILDLIYFHQFCVSGNSNILTGPGCFAVPRI